MATNAETVPTGGRKREPRHRVVVAARMKVDSAWMDVTILNVSSRGLMVKTATPVAPRSYVEIRKGTGLVVIGRVVWRRGQQVGIRAQDPLDVHSITHASGTPHRPRFGSDDRRGADRETPGRTAANLSRQVDRSREQSSMMQYGLLLVALAMAAYIAASTVHDAMATMTSKVSHALQGQTST